MFETATKLLSTGGASVIRNMELGRMSGFGASATTVATDTNGYETAGGPGLMSASEYTFAV